MKINSDVMKVIIFSGGVLTGGLISWLGCKKYYRDKCEKEIESVERAFTKRINELEGRVSDEISKANGYRKGSDDGNSVAGVSDSLSGRSSLLEGLAKVDPNTKVDYTKYYAKNSRETIEVDDHPRDDLEDCEDSDVLDSDSDYDAVNRYRPIVTVYEQGESVKPYVISANDYGYMPGWLFKEFYFYKTDGVMVEIDDGCEEIVDNYEYLLGDCLDTSGFKVNDSMSLYIRNEDLHTDYEISKVRGKYAE